VKYIISSKLKTIGLVGFCVLVFCIGHLLKISTITEEPIFSMKNLKYLALFLIIMVPIAFMWGNDEDEK
jgi:hypothetical protein